MSGMSVTQHNTSGVEQLRRMSLVRLGCLGAKTGCSGLEDVKRKRSKMYFKRARTTATKNLGLKGEDGQEDNGNISKFD